MKITVGELINELMVYSRDVQINMAGDFPFIRAEVGNQNCTKGYLYIVQTAEHQYSTCDCIDDLHGNKIMPTQNLEHPFVKERDVIKQKFHISQKECNKQMEKLGKFASENKKDPNDINTQVEFVFNEMDKETSLDKIYNSQFPTFLNLSYLGFLNHFYKVLFHYRVINVNPKIFEKEITDQEFTHLPSRVTKGLELLFKDRKVLNPKIKDIINIVKNPCDKFVIRGIKEKDIGEMKLKFEKMGITLEIHKNIITDLCFEKIN